jgi:BMFP domain-containing protein YqiC
MPADRPFPDALANIAATISDALTRVLPVGTDWRTRLTPVIEATIDRLDLVPREEFERQLAQLDRLNRDVAQLEARIRALEPKSP